MKTITMAMVEKYIESKQKAWAPSTLRSEAYRLQGMLPALNGNAQTLWDALANAAPYARLTSFTRAASFYDFLMAQGHAAGPNPYAAYRTENARLFKHVYQPKRIGVTYEEARKRIESMTDKEARDWALYLLHGGLRYTESFTYEEGVVVGKGSKPRKAFAAPPRNGFSRSYYAFRAALKKIGLRPHDLRKLCATRLAQAGLKEADLLKVMGWNSIKTAQSYLQPKHDDELAAVFATLLQGKDDDNEGKQVPVPFSKAS